MSDDPRAAEWIRRRCEGETLESIGEDYGLTRERIRQVTVEHAPHEPWKAVKRERKALLAEAERVRRQTPVADCRTCGAPVLPPMQVYCAVRCRQLAERLRLVTSEEAWESHRRAVATWTAETNDTVTPYVEKVLQGRTDEIDPYGRHLVEGSAVFDAALLAASRGWPIVEEFHPDIREQIEEYL